MSFNSILFIVFLIIIILCYYLVPKFQWVILLIGSILFYLTYGIEKFPFIVASTLIAYAAGRFMQSIYERQDAYIKEHALTGGDKKTYIATNKKKCKRILLLAVVILLLLLLYAKVGKWIFGQNGVIPVIVALGVSYYTFSLLAYLADVYWKKEKAEQNCLKFMLFAIYFPKILQGPISRHRNLAPQFEKIHKFDYERFCFGVQFMLWGFFKKMVIADRLSIFVNQVYGDYEKQAGSLLLVATMLGAMQLYCDFSGCMDIASGISECFGLELEKNFDHPFFSRSAAEFWRRWHITLGTWFKDYVYMPISVSPRLIHFAKPIKQKWGMKAAKNVMTVIPLIAVWLLTGLWHGTGWAYVAWGIYWGILIIGSMLMEPAFKKMLTACKINVETESWKVFQMVRTFLLFCIARVLTIPNDLTASVKIFRSIFTNFQIWKLVDGSLYQCGLDTANFNLAMITLGVLWCVSRLQEKGSIRAGIAKQNIAVRWVIYYIAFFSIIIFGIYGPGYDASAFVYMQY